MQVWFKNRRAKCRQQQKAAEQANKSGGSSGSSSAKDSASSPAGGGSVGTVTVKKSKSPGLSDGSASPPAPASVGAGGGYKPSAVSSPSSCSSAPGIWSPAVPPMTDLMSSVSSAACMQRATGGYMSNQSMHYSSQNYGASSYYGNMDYLSPMQLPIMTSSGGQQMSPNMNMNMHAHVAQPPPHMTGGGGYGPQAALPRTPGSSSGDSTFDYKDNSSWPPKFQIL